MITDRREQFFSSSSSIQQKKKNARERGEQQKRSLVTDNDGRSSMSVALVFFTMIIGQLRVNIKLLQSAFLLLFLLLRFFVKQIILFLPLSFFSSLYIEIYDIIVGAERKYRTTMLINLVPKKKKKKKKTYIKMRSSLYLCPYLLLIARLTSFSSFFFVL